MLLPLVAIALTANPGPSGEVGKPVVPLVSAARPKPIPAPGYGQKLAAKPTLKLKTTPNRRGHTK